MNSEGRGGRCKRSERPSGPTPSQLGYRLPAEVRAELDQLALLRLWEDVSATMTVEEVERVMVLGHARRLLGGSA